MISFWLLFLIVSSTGWVMVGLVLLSSVHRHAFVDMAWTWRIPMVFIAVVLWPLFIHVERQGKDETK